MKSFGVGVVVMAAGLAMSVSVSAQSAKPRMSNGHAHEEASTAIAAMRMDHDPLAPVYVVTSRESHAVLKDVVRDSVAKFDSVGTALMVSEIRAHQLGVVSERIHKKELRCGGFFAFRTRAEADAFIRNDRSAQIMRKALLATYNIDNGATVNPWLPQVSATNIYGTINTLSSYQNRYYASPTGKTSAEWIRTTWQNLAGSRTDVTSELVNCSNCATQPSVILTIQGSELANEVVVLGAHLDSINSSGGGSNTQVAPGADDDASGIATLTEVLRIAMASGWKPKRTVKFMGYAAEEVGLRGSNAIAQSFKTAGTQVHAVLQLDMTNYKPASGSDMRIVTDYSNADVKTFLANLFDTYLAPLGLTRGTYTCGYGCSDHASWTSAGYPAAIMFEGGGTSGYFSRIHSTGDTLANMGNSAANSAKFAKLGLAFLGEAAKTAGSGGGNAPPVANFTSSASGLTVTFTDTSTDSDGSVASRNWNFGDSTSSTVANPSHTYAAAGTYDVTLSVTDNVGATGNKTQAVTVGSGNCGGLVLCNGVSVALPSVATNGVSSTYTFDVPAGKTSVAFTISGGTGDADLYVRLGSAPTMSAYTCRPYLSGNSETCTFNAPTAGTYYINVRAYAAYSGVSLKATMTP